MKNKLSIISLFILILLSSCTRIHPVLFLRPSDLVFWPIVYILFAWGLAFILSLENKKKFWPYFILNLIVTPITGLFILLFRINKS